MASVVSADVEMGKVIYREMYKKSLISDQSKISIFKISDDSGCIKAIQWTSDKPSIKSGSMVKIFGEIR